MRWRHGVVSAVLLAAGTGCPHDHMREGFLDRAARKDTRDAMEQECLPGEELREDCKENEQGVTVCQKVCQ
jgi:hypothetical protein